MRDIQRILELWGNWSSNKTGTEYPSIAAGMNDSVTFESIDSCGDDDGLIIDSCVARLKEYSSDEYDLLVDHYQKKQSLRRIARNEKCSDNTIRVKIQHAQGFVNGLLYSLNIRLQCEI